MATIPRTSKSFFEITHSTGTGKFNAPQVTIYVHDIDFEPGQADNKDKHEVGFQVHRNMKLVDIASLEDPHLMRVSLRNAKVTECIRILVQNQHDDEFFGSISINISKYLLGP
jgi:hypothetical protein